MTATTGGRSLRVRNWREVPERPARGQLKVRRVFDAADGGFESCFGFAQYNYLQPGEANETHNHEDIEKVYYVVQGECLVRCGDHEATVRAGDFFFLPVRLPHSVTNTGSIEAQMVVFAAKV
jgi:mannose-6-phosphate isomerase-like protein (cupin superfamily)